MAQPRKRAIGAVNSVIKKAGPLPWLDGSASWSWFRWVFLGEHSVKVIFVDIDDVANSDRLIASCVAFDEVICPPVKIPLRGDPVVMALFNQASERCAAELVISSIWLNTVGWQFTRKWLLRSGLDLSRLHADPCVTYGPSGEKSVAIDDWLKQHPEIPTKGICVVDDDRSLFSRGHALVKRQVVVDGPDGLQLAHYRAIVQKLGKAKRQA